MLGLYRLFIENSGRLTFVVDDLPEFDTNVGVVREEGMGQRCKDGFTKNDVKE